jgi:hypothetical protein
MKTTSTLALTVVVLPLAFAACSDTADTGVTQPVRQADATASALANRAPGKGRDDVQIVSATGDITSAIANFRALFPGPTTGNGAKPGDQGDGHREINWDGPIPTNTDAFPGNFFNVNSTRGLVMSTPGTGFRVSDNGYTDVNQLYDGEFVPFSPKKMFIAVGSTVTDVTFFVAGTATPAAVTGFGSVFEDVGRAHSTTIEYFDAQGHSLLKVAAPRRSGANGISFLGAVFDTPIVARVRITAGDTPLSATTLDNVKGKGPKQDLVAMDDFFYGEPHAIR